MRYVTPHDGCLIEETEPLNLSDLTNKMASIVRRDSSFVAVGKSVIKFSVSFEKEHNVSFLNARMVDIVEETFLSDFLTSKDPQIYQRYIRVGKFLCQRPMNFNTIEYIEGKETGSRMLGISNIVDGTLFSS